MALKGSFGFRTQGQDMLMGKKQRREAASRERLLDAAGVLGTEPASENRILSCCGSTSGIRFYCKPVTLVRCREIRGEIRFSGRVVGEWLCEMVSAFIIKELRGRSAFPPPLTKDKPVSLESFSGVTGFLFPLVSKGFAPVSHLSRTSLQPPDSLHSPHVLSLFDP